VKEMGQAAPQVVTQRPHRDPCVDADLMRRLSYWNRRRLPPRAPSCERRTELEHNHKLTLLEGEVLEAVQGVIAARASEAPHDENGFADWFEALERSGPGQGDALFPWLAEHATYQEMRWFIEQEVAGEAGFDDLVALTQIKLPERPKLELARNYWDEMGRGNAEGMHGPMLGRLAGALDITAEIDTTLAPPLALNVTMIGLAANRRYAFHAVGALGVIELTAPGRARLVAAGLRRLGLPPAERRYFDLHATLDVRHSEAWVHEVIRPLVAEDGARARCIAEGALMRLVCGQRCFDAYRTHLWGGDGVAPPS